MELKSCPIDGLGSILVATDASEFSEGAVRAGTELAKTCGAKITVLRVIEFNPEFDAHAPDLAEKLEIEARQKLDDVKGVIEKQCPGCEALLARSEKPYERIVEEAEKLGPDIIVMGRRGRTGLKRVLMGSVTARVIGHSPVNVLVVPREAAPAYKNILVATDGSDDSRAAAVEALRIARTTGGALSIMAVTDVDVEEARRWVDEIKELADREGVSSETIVQKGIPHESIVGQAREKNADLIVVGSHGRTGLGKLLMGSVTERVIGFAHCAVLVVKKK